MPPLILHCRQRRVVTTIVIRLLSSSHRQDQSQATAAALERQKRPTRGGQNLSNRYRRLERSIRGKGALLKGLETLPRPSAPVSSRGPPTQGQADNKMFRGFRIPEEPKCPEADGAFTWHISDPSDTISTCGFSRVLHVRVYYLCVRHISRFTHSLQRIPLLLALLALGLAHPRVGMAFERSNVPSWHEFRNEFKPFSKCFRGVRTGARG
jgi:hypothetical protein